MVAGCADLRLRVLLRAHGALRQLDNERIVINHSSR